MTNVTNYNFAGKKALVRVDFNVPLNDKGQRARLFLRCRSSKSLMQ